MRYVIYADARGRWRWVLLSENNRRIEQSAKGCQRKDHCVASIVATKRRALAGTKTARAGIYLACHPSRGWTAVASVATGIEHILR
jgi:uncharacterized protein YegP (UPF0339 family)